MLLEIFILVSTALCFLHWWARSYWKRRNVFFIQGHFLFGSIKNVFLRKQAIPDMFSEIYWKHKNERLIGFYSFYTPMLLATDPETIKRILITDFNTFHENGFEMDEKIDPVFCVSPFPTKGVQEWKEKRSIQTALQTAVKLKEFTPGLVRVGKNMTDFIMKHHTQPIMLKDLATRYTVDNAALSAYGVEPNSFNDPEFGFMKHASGDKLFTPSSLSAFCPLFAPILVKLLSLRIVSKEAEDFFTSMSKSNIEQRQGSKTYRGDLIDHIMKISKKKIEENNSGFSLQDVAGHCLAFYLDATESSANVMTFLLLEMANNQDIQEKLRNEILNVGKEAEDFDFEKVNSLSYLEMVLNECLRMHPTVSILSRICTKDITIDDVNIQKGTKIFICPYNLHYDPDFFSQPEVFNPERFSAENKDSITKYAYLPFGEGPRICVGKKYAQLQLKLALLAILLKFRVLPSNGNKQKIVHNPEGVFILIPPYDTTLKFQPL